MAWSTRQATKKALELGRRAGCTKESVAAVAERGPDMNDLAATERGTAPLRFNPTIGLAGFGVLLGWHFLILYFSFPMAGELITAEYAFLRQVALNASLCVFFGLFGRLMKNLPQRDGIKSHTISYSATAIGVLGNVLLLASPTLGIVWSMVAVAIIGASESVLMLFWLRFYTETAENYTGKCLGASAVLASLICFFTYHLTVEVSMVVLAALPLASGALLVCMTKDVPLRKNDPSGLGSGIPDWGPVRKPYWKATAQLMAMSLFFGVVQGCSSPEKTLLPAADPVHDRRSGVHRRRSVRHLRALRTPARSRRSGQHVAHDVRRRHDAAAVPRPLPLAGGGVLHHDRLHLLLRAHAGLHRGPVPHST